MVYLSKKDADKIVKELSNINNEETKKIVSKINNPQKLAYTYDKSQIKRLLNLAFKQKRKVKIKYYSLSSDEIRFRVIDILKIHKDCIIAYCHLREEERTFVIKRIYSAAILEQKYNTPKNWSPESIILDK